MTWNLTFKRKVFAAITTAVVGLLVLGTVATRTLGRLGTAVLRANGVAETARVSSQAEISALLLADESRRVTTETTASFLARVHQVTEVEGKALEQASQTAGETDLANTLEAIRTALTQYTGTLQSWVERTGAAGRTDSEGLRGTTEQAGQALEEALKYMTVLAKPFAAARIAERNFVLQRDPKQAEEAKAGVAEAQEKMASFGYAEAKSAAGVPISALFDQYAAALDQYTAALTEAWSLEEGMGAQLEELKHRAAMAQRRAGEVLDAAGSQANTESRRSKTVILGGGAVLAAILVGLLSWLGIGAVHSLAKINTLVGKMADGDLTSQLDDQHADEFGDLARSMNQMGSNLGGIVRHVSDTSTELASAAEQLSATTTQMAGNNESVSARSQDVASACEEMGVTVREVANNTEMVSTAAEEARHAAEEGSRVVVSTVRAIHDISSAVESAAQTVRILAGEAGNIANVIATIEEIADQTNLLALNAAIEAARAGDQGRGFAVVADEVRKLAEKTMRATGEISSTLASIRAQGERAVEAMDAGQNSVAEGKAMGEQAGHAINGVTTRVTEASQQAQQIATAIQQLSATISEMIERIEEVAREVTQNTEAGAEIARTAEQLSSQAIDLKSLTHRFRT